MSIEHAARLCLKRTQPFVQLPHGRLYRLTPTAPSNFYTDSGRSIKGDHLSMTIDENGMPVAAEAFTWYLGFPWLYCRGGSDD